MKKAIKILLWSLLVLVTAFGVLVWAQIGPFVKGAKSVVKLDEGLYYMEYKGDDGFAALIESGGGRSAGELSRYVMSFLSKGFYHPEEGEPVPARYGCSAFTARTPDGGVLMGRNFDFNSATGIVLHTVPKSGYETYTTFNLEFLGFGEGWLPEGARNRYMALSVLFFALDGINEKGLAVADLMAGDNAETHQEDSGKPSLTTTSAICYLLKNAATVDEALDLLRGIDMHSDIGAAHHYAVSDATGKSVVVEYVDNRMEVVESAAVANHYLCPSKLNVGLMEGDLRYDFLCRQMENSDGVMDKLQLTKSIAAVSQPEREGNFLGTAWTLVMDLTDPSVTYYSRRHFDNPFSFGFDQAKKRGRK